ASSSTLNWFYRFRRKTVMKRMVLMALLALTLPLAAFADNSVDFTNSGGMLSGSSAGMTLGSSELIAVNGFGGGGLITGALGTMSFSTGSLASGSLAMGAVFNAGGTFMITGNGTDGLPSGALFTGSFSRPVSLAVITLANGTHDYTL